MHYRQPQWHAGFCGLQAEGTVAITLPLAGLVTAKVLAVIGTAPIAINQYV
jgi:hypothetical protein